MKFVIFAAVIGIALSLDCDVGATMATVDLGNAKIIKVDVAYAAATCTTGTFKAAVTQTYKDVAALGAAIKALATAKKATNGGVVAPNLAGWVACKSGYKAGTGGIKYKCAATGAITIDNCVEKTKCATAVAAVTGANSYAAFGAGTLDGATASTACTGAKKNKNGKVTAACSGTTFGTPNVSQCTAAAYWGTCPVPTCGDAKSTATVSCNAAGGEGTDNCGAAAVKTAAGFECAADTTTGTCTAPACDEKTAWAGGVMTKEACTASAAATKSVAAGGTLSGYTCTIRCKTGKANVATAVAGRTCKTVADTEAYWKAASGSGGSGGSSANALSVFAAFAVVLAYLA